MSKAVSRRSLLKLAGLGTGAVLLAACQPATEATPAPGAPADATPVPGETPQATPPPAGQQPVSLRFRSWVSGQTSPLDQAWYDWLAANYPEDSGGSTVEFEVVPFGAEYIQKLLADVAAGSPPDLLDSSIIWARDFYDRAVLLDLTDHLDATPELAADQFVGDATNAYRSKDGRYYGVPYWGPDSQVIAINSAHFEEAGLDPQGADIETWDDLVEVASTLTVRSGNNVERAGFLVGSLRYIESFASWMYANGGTLHDDDITEPTFNNERGEQVVQLQLDLLNTHNVSFPISPDRQDTQLFMQGQASMAPWGTWAPTQLAGTAPEGFQYWLILFPEGPMGDGPRVTTWSNMIVIPQRTRYPDQAFDLARYCAAPPNVITRFELSNRTTPHRALYESEAWQSQIERYPAVSQVPVAAEVGGVYPFFPVFTEANDAIGVELELVMLGEKTVQQGLADAEAAVTAVLERRAQT